MNEFKEELKVLRELGFTGKEIAEMSGISIGRVFQLTTPKKIIEENVTSNIKEEIKQIEVNKYYSFDYVLEICQYFRRKYPEATVIFDVNSYPPDVYQVKINRINFYNTFGEFNIIIR